MKKNRLVVTVADEIEERKRTNKEELLKMFNRLKEKEEYKTPHVPHAHVGHNKTCGCATDIASIYCVCKYCGAAYTIEPTSFVRWVCYDCNQINSLEQVRRVP